MKKILFLLAAGCCAAQVLHAQKAALSSAAIALPPGKPDKAPKKHAWYFSWGYNTESYTRSDVHIRQPELGNDYTMVAVHGNDHRGWDDRFLHQQLTIPQYNYRLGYMLDDARGIGVELNFDHTKYIISDDQSIHIRGKFGDSNGDTTVRFSKANGSYYYLNNGANFFLFNIVKRWKLYHTKNEALRLDGLGKFGVGPVVPHVANSLFGNGNHEDFQLGGWNTGLEGDLKVSYRKYIYLEYGMKLDYARYSNLTVYKGTARQAFGTYEMILSLGVNYPTGRRRGGKH